MVIITMMMIAMTIILIQIFNQKKKMLFLQSSDVPTCCYLSLAPMIILLMSFLFFVTLSAG